MILKKAASLRLIAYSNNWITRHKVIFLQKLLVLVFLAILYCAFSCFARGSGEKVVHFFIEL